MTGNNWPEVWWRIRAGYGRHVQVLEEMAVERLALERDGYGDPQDGFVSAALHAARFERDAAFDAQKAHSAEALAHTFERTLQDLRYYADADLGWSRVWEEYWPEFVSWTADIRSFLELGRRDPARFIDYTTRGWEL